MIESPYGSTPVEGQTGNLSLTSIAETSTRMLSEVGRTIQDGYVSAKHTVANLFDATSPVTIEGEQRPATQPAKAEDKQSIKDLVEQLGHEDFFKREAATRLLAQRGMDALPELVKNIGEDVMPEIQARALGLIDKLVDKSVFDTCRDIANDENIPLDQARKILQARLDDVDKLLKNPAEQLQREKDLNKLLNTPGLELTEDQQKRIKDQLAEMHDREKLKHNHYLLCSQLNCINHFKTKHNPFPGFPGFLVLPNEVLPEDKDKGIGTLNLEALRKPGGDD